MIGPVGPKGPPAALPEPSGSAELGFVARHGALSHQPERAEADAPESRQSSGDDVSGSAPEGFGPREAPTELHVRPEPAEAQPAEPAARPAAERTGVEVRSATPARGEAPPTTRPLPELAASIRAVVAPLLGPATSARPAGQDAALLPLTGRTPSAVGRGEGATAKVTAVREVARPSFAEALARFEEAGAGTSRFRLSGGRAGPLEVVVATRGDDLRVTVRALDGRMDAAVAASLDEVRRRLSQAELVPGEVRVDQERAGQRRRAQTDRDTDAFQEDLR